MRWDLHKRWFRPTEPDPDDPSGKDLVGGGILGAFFRVILTNRMLVVIAVVGLVAFGIQAAKDVPVDAIPDISENQVVVYSPWPGRSPKDVEDQVTYPLSVALQGIPKVYDVRSISGVGFSLSLIHI